MAHTRKSHEHDSTNGAVPGGRSDKDASDNPIDPRAFGLAKAAYGVGETLDLLSIGRCVYRKLKSERNDGEARRGLGVNE